MILPGETEAGSAGTQPCRGISRWAHRADVLQRGTLTSRAASWQEQSSDDRPPCLENPRPAGAESTLTENVASPFHAEPGQLVGTTTAAQNVTVTNTSDARLSIGRVQVTGDFSVGSNKCRLVAPGGTCTLQVRFTPTTAGICTGRLRLLDPVGRRKQVVALTGLGVDSVASANPTLP